MNEEKRNVILSLDEETDGVWGQAIAIAAVVYDENGVEIASFCERSNEKVQNEWVKDNVEPELKDVKCVGGYIVLLASFARFYNFVRERYNVTALWHMGHVVEAYLFRELVSNGLIGQWDAPYTPIEVADHLRTHGYAPDSVDNYAQEHGIEMPDEIGSTHNPLYDCVVAYKVYNHLNNK